MACSPARSAFLSCVVLLGSLVFATGAHAATASASGSVLTFVGDAGNDLLNVFQTAPTRIVFDGGAASLSAGAGCATIPDTADADAGVDGGANVECNTGTTWTELVIEGGDGTDVLTMNSFAGTQIVSIPTTIRAGAGDDAVTGGSAADNIDAGTGSANDYGRGGNDTLTSAGGAGDFVILRGNEGDDALTFTGSADAQPNLWGEAGVDTITGGAADSFINGGEGADLITGGSGNDTINGDLGSDTIAGGAGNDSIEGGSTTIGMGIGASDGADSIDGGDGIDTISYDRREAGVTVNLAVATGHGAAGENDTVTNVEDILGGNGPDVLTGNASANTIQGSGGADTIDGAGGYDQLRGGLDADTINAASDVVPDLVDCGAGRTVNTAGSADTDTANLDYVDVLDSSADCETVNRATAPGGAPQPGTNGDDVINGTPLGDLIFGLAGNDTINGGDGDDELYGNAGADTLNGDAGNDELVGNADGDTLRGGAGNDELDGRRGADRLFGDAGNDDLDGGADRDSLAGGAGNDDLRGGAGPDTLAGGAGADVVVGGAGADTADGGAGRDVLFMRDGARDTITCTKVNLRNRVQRAQRDYLVVDRIDRIRNRAWCARIAVL